MPRLDPIAARCRPVPVRVVRRASGVSRARTFHRHRSASLSLDGTRFTSLAVAASIRSVVEGRVKPSPSWIQSRVGGMAAAALRSRACAVPAVARVVVLMLAGIGCAGGASQVAPEPAPWTPETLFPLAEGRAWSFDVETGDGDNVLVVTRVITAVPGKSALVQVGKEQTAYERRPEGWYRPAKGGFLLREPLEVGASWTSGKGVEAKLTRQVAAIETPAGDFTNCAEVEETNQRSGNRIWTTYCPHVGPVRVVSEMIVRGHTLRVTAVMRGYSEQAPSPDDS